MQFTQREVVSQTLSVANLDATNLQEEIQLLLREVIHQLVLGDPVFIQATGFFTGFEDHHVMAVQGAAVGARESSRPGADHGDALAGSGGAVEGVFAEVRIVDGITLQQADQHGFRIVEEMKDGLSRWMDSQGYNSLQDFSGRAVGNTTDWKYLDINYQVIAKIDQEACIGCGRCHIACEDTSHQAIASLKQPDGTHKYEVIDDECVGCNLCQITCPVADCIEMVPMDTGKPFLNWTQDPRNPYREAV